MSRRPHLAFVLEQTLGHVTHAANLRAALADDPAADISWLPLEYPDPFPPGGRPRLTLPNWTLRASLAAHRRLATLDRQRPIDGYFFHTQVTALGALDLARRRPVVVSLDATPRGFDRIGGAYGHASGGPLEAVKEALARRLFGRVAALVCWSAWAKRSLVDDYGVPPERVAVIAPGTDLALWRAERPPAEDNRPARILFVGGDFGRKGGYDLLAATAHLRPARCTVDVVTRAPVPPGPGLTVHAGLTPNSPALRRLFAEADLFALPTYADGLPMVLMEALAAGLPVVSTPVGAVGEAVVHCRTGLLVPPGSVADLRTALDALVARPGLRQRLGRAGRRLAEARFDARTNALHLRDLLLDTVAHAG